ncbi:MAG: hypothetical protein JWP94_1153 [Mucilaginibacter sp.]|nr:hypothetical protein [Mucilaginibacter sp.]
MKATDYLNYNVSTFKIFGDIVYSSEWVRKSHSFSRAAFLRQKRDVYRYQIYLSALLDLFDGNFQTVYQIIVSDNVDDIFILPFYNFKI